jgi:hypothetical protein
MQGLPDRLPGSRVMSPVKSMNEAYGCSDGSQAGIPVAVLSRVVRKKSRRVGVPAHIVPCWWPGRPPSLRRASSALAAPERLSIAARETSQASLEFFSKFRHAFRSHLPSMSPRVASLLRYTFVFPFGHSLSRGCSLPVDFATLYPSGCLAAGLVRIPPGMSHPSGYSCSLPRKPRLLGSQPAPAGMCL